MIFWSGWGIDHGWIDHVGGMSVSLNWMRILMFMTRTRECLLRVLMTFMVVIVTRSLPVGMGVAVHCSVLLTTLTLDCILIINLSWRNIVYRTEWRLKRGKGRKTNKLDNIIKYVNTGERKTIKKHIEKQKEIVGIR